MEGIMLKMSRILSVVSAVLILVSSLSVPALAVKENQLPSSSYSSSKVIAPILWSQYLNIAKKYGCTFDVKPSQRAAFSSRVSLSEFEAVVKEEKSKIVTTETIVTQLTTKDENPLMASAVTARVLTASTATTQKVWSGSNYLGGILFLNARIAATYYTSTNTFKSCDSVGSSITGFTTGFSYAQDNYSANISSTKKTLTVDVYGTESIVEWVNGYGTLLSFGVHRTFLCQL